MTDRPQQLIQIAALSVIALLSQSSLAQRSQDAIANPVYLADAPVAIETIERALILAQQGSHTEAARTLSQLIIEQGDRLTPDEPESGVSIPVRRRIQQVLINNPELLEIYRRINTPKAQRMLDDGQWTQAALDYWLTTPGCGAGLNQAQILIESARFGAGVRILQQLVGHPDAAMFASRGFELAHLSARAWNDELAQSVAQQWADLGGIRFEMGSRLAPLTSIELQVTALRSTPIETNIEELRLEGIVPRPIASARLTPSPATDGIRMGEIEELDDSQVSGAVSKPKPWSMPVVMGDALVTNDGVTISCFDRFTLRPRWRVTTTATEAEEQDRTSIGVRARIARTVEDLSSVTIVEGKVYAAAGIARTGGRTGDNRLLSISLKTGQILNATTLGELDPSLESSYIRGTVIVDGDTIIIAARKNLRRERLVALSLVGIDRRSFKLLWTRQIGSAGSLPFQQIGQIAHSGVIADGVVYWTDMMGLVCAVEASTGQILWAKAMPSTDVYARYEREPWTISTPIVHNEAVYILSADGQTIQKLDKSTGRLLSSNRSMTSGQGLYLVETPTQLACVNQTNITMHSLDQFGITKPKPLTPTGDGRAVIRGRVVSSGSTLIIPIQSGLALVDSDRIGHREIVELEETGLAIALDGQILVAGENEVSSYLSWDIARRLLTERIDRTGDIHSAITLGDLAFRAEHHDQIIPAIDRAIGMIRNDDLSKQEQNDARERLFSIILEMVGLPNRPRPDLPWLNPVIRGTLLDRTRSVASSPEQTLAHQMTQGAWMTALGQVREAVAIYHAVLHDDSLASQMWRGGGLAIRAEIEATHQLDVIVAGHGRRACAVFDDLAAADRDAMNANAHPERFEQLARRYPWAPSTPGAWAMAAQRWGNDSNAPAAVRAARSGFDSIKRLNTHGIRPDQTTLNTLGSVLVGGLLDSQRQGEAARTATQLTSDFPSIVLTINGQPIDAGALSIGLSSGSNAPQLGSRFVVSDSPTLLAGSPVTSPNPFGRSDFDSMVMFAPQLAQARMVRFTNAMPEVMWTRRSPDVDPPMVVVQNDFQTVLHWAPVAGDPRSGSIESIETNTGSSRWKIDTIGGHMLDDSLRQPDQMAEIDGQFISPTEGVVMLDQILSTSDGSVLVLVDRIGRAMGIDLLTGQVLWKRDLPINRVHDVDLSAGVLGIGGMWFVDRDKNTGVVQVHAPRIASIDARTGQTIQLLDAQTSSPRWVRVAPSGNLIVGTNLRVMSVSTRTGTLDWLIHNPDLFRTNAGWIIDDTLVVLDEFVNLWPIGLNDGKTPMASLDTANRIVERGWVEVRSHNGNIAFVASAGMGVFDHDGGVLGIDPQRTSRPYIGVAWGSDRIVLVRRAVTDNDASMRIPVLLLDQHTAQLNDTINLLLPSAIQRQPTSVAAANGVVVIGFGEVSVVVPTQ